jgi:hypothetical protein
MAIYSSSFPVFSRLTEFSCEDFQLIKLATGDEYVYGEEIWRPTDLQFFQTIPVLSFRSRDWLEDLPSFHNLRSLAICECKNFISLPLLPVLRQLKIIRCKYFNSLDIVGSPDLKYPIYDLQIMGCKMEKVSFQRKLFLCSITKCRRLRQLEVFEPIDSLKIRFCENLRKITNQSLIVSVDASRKCWYNRTGDIEIHHQEPTHRKVKQTRIAVRYF